MLVLFSTKEVAETLKTSDREIRRKIKNGKINAHTVRLNNNQYFYGVDHKELIRIVDETEKNQK